MLPIEFTNRMKILLGEKYSDYESAILSAPVRAFRINTNKIKEQDFMSVNPFGGKKVPFSDNSYYFDYDKIGNHPYHHAGMIYIQEPAAMSAVSSIDIQSDWHVLDLCAAPGGKSIQAAEKLKNGVLVSNEIIPSRCKILTGNIERMGFKNVITTCTDSARLSALFGEEFDLVIVDAPCSGEGMFRKDETAVSEWSENNVKLCAKRQSEILENIYSVVKYDGYLLYSTCTFSVEENEKTVDAFLSAHPEFELVPVKDAVAISTCNGINFDGCQTKNIDLCRRFYPHISDGEGQFIALLHKKDCGINYSIKRNSAIEQLSKDEQKIVFDFLDDTLLEYDKAAVGKYKDNIVYFEPDFCIPNGIAFSCGVTVGSIKKNYVLPHHQFFTAMGNYFRRRIDLDEVTAEKYIHGETFSCNGKNGWSAVLINNCTIGGAKVVDGMAKNHYPKGLRK